MSAGRVLREGDELPPYVVRAVNDAAESENKIHDDAVARRYGFRGGLVPGVTVHAYMTQPVVEAFGRPWVEHGSMTARFLEPVYEGQDTTVSARVTRRSEEGIELALEMRNPSGGLCAIGTASLPAAPAPAPTADAVPAAIRTGERPPADERSLAIGTVLGTLRETCTVEDHGAYLDLIAEPLPLFRGPAAVVHPGWLMRRANFVLAENVRLGPWMHVSSEVTHFGVLHPGDTVETRAVVTALFERKGHRFVDLDVLMLGPGGNPVLRTAHRSIYQPRVKE